MKQPASTTPATMLATPLCLASGSPRRADILSNAGLQFEIDSAEIDESLWLQEGAPDHTAVRLATEKAKAVALRHPKSLVLAADTLVVLNGQILGKPAGPDDALNMLERLRGRSHEVITGVALVTGVSGDLVVADTETTTVDMREYTLDEMTAYIATGSPLDKAGAYGIQDEPFRPAESITGCYLNVVGLPLCLTTRLLTSAGVLASDNQPACSAHDQIGGAA